MSIKAALLHSLSTIRSPDSLEFVKDLLDHANSDEVQAAALYAYVEFTGFDGIAYVEKLKPLGLKAATEQQESLKWLKESTRADSKHAFVVNKGFGLEAVKGALFRSLTKEDEPLLLRMRVVGYYSPNAFSDGRARTIGIMLRHIRQEL